LRRRRSPARHYRDVWENRLEPVGVVRCCSGGAGAQDNYTGPAGANVIK